MLWVWLSDSIPLSYQWDRLPDKTRPRIHLLYGIPLNRAREYEMERVIAANYLDVTLPGKKERERDYFICHTWIEIQCNTTENT